VLKVMRKGKFQRDQVRSRVAGSGGLQYRVREFSTKKRRLGKNSSANSEGVRERLRKEVRKHLGVTLRGVQNHWTPEGEENILAAGKSNILGTAPEIHSPSESQRKNDWWAGVEEIERTGQSAENQKSRTDQG